MATLDFFANQMTRLHRAFGIIAGESKMAERLGLKIAEWYDMWQKTYSLVSDEVLTRMVDKAIKEYERLPTFAQLRVLRASVQGEMPSQGYAKSSCGMCRDGLLFGWQDVKGYGLTTYSFRCSACENWRGRYDGLPMWNPAAGYNPGEAPRPKSEPYEGPYRPKGIPGFPVLSDEEKDRVRRDSLRLEEKRSQTREPGEDSDDAFSQLGFERR